jgi:peptide/nickel transport system permease protein
MRYWVTRLAGAVLLLLVISMLTFGAMNVLGDPLFNILGPTAGDVDNPESVIKIEAAKEEYNLDEPLPVRYAIWLGGFVRGDFGVQFSEDGQPPVRDLIVERLPRTLSLVIMAQLMALVIALPWALWSASRANSRSDKASTVGAFLLISIPNFALAVILSYFLSIKLGWFPLVYQADSPLLSRFHQLILPAFTLALPAAAVYQRLLRTDLITTLQEDFILTARAKGVGRRTILFKHALRPSLFSFVTVFGLTTGALIGGALVVESIFLIPGLGRAIVEAVLREDFPVVLAIVMIVSAIFVFLNLIVDLIYSLIDPRVRR